MLPQRKRYVVDPDNPRAPSQALWETLSEEERAEVIDALPSSLPRSEASPPEGDQHFDEVVRSREVLRRYFGSRGGGVYVGNDLPVYYPDEAVFAPDVLVVLDVQPGPRDRWAVQAEGKGLDLVMEILWSGSRKKDLRDNVARYASLGIREYFVFDKRKQQLVGYKLAPGSSEYTRILPRARVVASEVLGLGIGLEEGRLRFYHPDGATVPELQELLERMQASTDLALESAEERALLAEERARLAEENAEERVRLAEERAEQRARLAEERTDALRERLAQLEAELQSLREGGRVPKA